MLALRDKWQALTLLHPPGLGFRVRLLMRLGLRSWGVLGVGYRLELEFMCIYI